MKVGIISGRYPKTEFDSAINHKLYAESYGYTYIHCNWPTKAKNPYLNKIYYLLEYIDLFDYLVWIDDDAFFYDFEKNIMTFKPEEDSFISFCKSPDFKTMKTYLSSGQFILKCNQLSKSFLENILNQDLKEIKKWWKPSLGYFSNGDQDIIIYLLLNNKTFKDKFTLYNYKKFNSRFENLIDQDLHQPLILHFTGKPEVKKNNYETIQQQYDLKASLVKSEILKNYINLDIGQPSKKSFLRRLKIFFQHKLS